MKNYSPLNNQNIESPLNSASMISQSGGQGGSKKKNLSAGVLLTSLIDAFSILVIYLLMNFSNSGEILYLTKDMELPASTKYTELQRTTVIKVDQGKFYVDEEEVEQGQLVSLLLTKRQEFQKIKDAADPESSVASAEPSVIIQSDKKEKYLVVNSAVLASNHAGFNEIRFAVLAIN